MSKRPLIIAQEESDAVAPKSPKLGDSADEHKAANEEIHRRVQVLRVLESQGTEWLLASTLQIVYRQALSDGYMKGNPDLSWCITLVNMDPDVRKALQNGIDEGHYEDAMSLAVSRYNAHHILDQKYLDWSVDHTTTAATLLAWSQKFHGNYHEIMLTNINAMRRRGVYTDSVALVQSSGTGKSRMVDEQANLVFTIPFNLRDPAERKSGAYPHEDAEVRNYLCDLSRLLSTKAAADRAALFFGQLFFKVARKVENIFSTNGKLSPGCLARRWRTYLLQGENRSQLYRAIIDACQNAVCGLPSQTSTISDYAMTQFQGLLSALTTICDFPKLDNVKVMLYFDEAHELRLPITIEDSQTVYDIVSSSLDAFRSPAVFTIFLSTQSSLTLLAPSPQMTSSARQEDTTKPHAPITETPFDCHPDFPLLAGQFQLQDLGDLRFLARFGRPLFWSMIEATKGDDLVVDSAMRLARMKLLFDVDILKTMHSNTAMLAILDILITIDYELRRDLGHETQMAMVASHMRTVFSVPAHRFYFCSGYPSEPFLAEAASRQMYHYLRHSTAYSSNRMISILKTNLDNGLIDLGQKGEVVMRLLLRKAYIDAIVAEQVDANSSDPEPNFSKGCSFLEFLKALFSNSHQAVILKAEPNNGVEQCALEDAFRDAVVRFTHFVKAADNSVVTTNAMAPSFLRGSAFICHNCQNAVDIVIPVLLDKCNKLEESAMSALFIQVKRRKKAGSTNAYIIDEKKLDFFPAAPTTGKSLRPYVTLVAELGVDVTSKSNTLDTGHSATRTSPCTSSKAKVKAKHPRYNLRAYGCTNKTWKVISDTEQVEYTQVLDTDDFIKDHPRQNRDTLQLVRQMLQLWYQDAAWVSDGPEPTEIIQSSATMDVGNETDSESLKLVGAQMDVE